MENSDVVTWGSLAGLSAAIWVALATQALSQSTQFTVEKLIVEGSTTVAAEGLNDRGAIVGYYQDSAAATHGFILDGSTTTLLPPFRIGSTPVPVFPTGINNNAQVVGSAGTGSTGSVVFLWQNGAYAPTGPVGPISTAAGRICYLASAAQINGRGVAHYPCQAGSEVQDFIGVPGAYKPFQPFSTPTRVMSMNDKGEVAGQTYQAAPRSEALPGVAFVFFGAKGHLTYLKPNNTAQGGFINDLEQVAGTFVDKSGIDSGFVFQMGKYAVFKMPVVAHELAVGGINNAGRVVGSFLDDTANLRRVFLFNGKTVSTFGSFNPSHTLFITVNNNGVILLADYEYGNLQSYRVVCRGSGC